MEKRSKKKNNYNNDDKGFKDEIINNSGGGRSATTDSKAATDHNYSRVINTSTTDHQDYNLVGDGVDLLGGFSWPPRSYTCTFCKREFRSAQALGGHMNVHRRDRARLRQMPSSTENLSSNYSLLNLNLHPSPCPSPNPNPRFSTYLSSTATMFSSFASTSSLPPTKLISSSPSSIQPNMPCLLSPSNANPSYRLHPRGTTANLTIMKSQIPPFGVPKCDGFLNENERQIVRLNLEIGLLGESKSDDVDLELRLGCS